MEDRREKGHPRRFDGCVVSLGGKNEYRHTGCAVDLLANAGDDMPHIYDAEPRAENEPTCAKCGKPIQFL